MLSMLVSLHLDHDWRDHTLARPRDHGVGIGIDDDGLCRWQSLYRVRHFSLGAERTVFDMCIS